MLIDRADGMPLIQPTYYITSMIYLPGQELNTQNQILSSIQFLYEWCRRNGIDIEERFRQGNFLELREVERLCVDIRMDFRNYCYDPFCSEEAGSPKPRSKKINRLHRPRQAKPLESQYNCDTTTAIKLLYIKNYLDWLTNETISKISAKRPVYSSMHSAKSEMIKWIKERIPDSGKAPMRRGLAPEARKRLLEVIHPDHPDNPFKSEFVRMRNRLLILFMDRLGIRRAEALLIKIGKFINLHPAAGSDEGSVEIREHRDDLQDPRRKRPQLKTSERPLPLGLELCRLTLEYINKYRGKKPDARCHGYLFVSRSGVPMSLSSLDVIFEELRGVEGMPDDLTAHVLRYTWNDRFSGYADEMIGAGKWTIKDEEAIRRLQQGWSHDSKMPALYSRRFLEEKSRQVSIHMQEDLYIVKPPFAKMRRVE